MRRGRAPISAPTIDGGAAGARTSRSPAAGKRSCAFGERRRGARAYLAVDGGIAIPPVLGSRATHARSGIGGLKGRALAAGDRLELGDPVPRRTAGPVHDVARAGLASARLPAAAAPAPVCA